MAKENVPDNLTKMEYPDHGLLGYNVRFRRDGKRHNKMFSVSKYGSWESALAHALDWRDQFLERWKNYCGGKDEKIQYRGTNTGYPGISIDDSGSSPDLKANYKDKEGNPKCKTFALPSKDSDDFEQVFDEQFTKARKFIDEYNRARFGGRWYRYKDRKGII